MPSDKVCKTIHQYNKAPLPPEDFGEKTVQRMEDDGLDLYTALVKA